MLERHIRLKHIRHMSQLSEYLTASGLTQEKFSRRVGVSQETISKLCTGAQGPSLRLAAAIERETQGAVPAISWVGRDASESAA